MFEGLFGTEIPLVIRLCLAFLIVLGLISAAAWTWSRSGRGRLAGASGRQSRLEIIDSAIFEGSRRLILIRRDNVEHLLMIGGPTDVVVETNILHASGAPLELSVTHSPAAAERQPLAIPQPGKGSRPLPPEPMAIPRPAPQFKPPAPAPAFKPLSQELTAGQLQAQAEPWTRPQRDTLAALADELSTRPSAPPKGSATPARSHPDEPRPEPQSEPGHELRSEPGTELRSQSGPENQPQSPVETQPVPPRLAQRAAEEIASTADEDLAKLARLLEARLRNPNVSANARSSAAPARGAPPPQRALAAEVVPTPPSPARPPSEPRPSRADPEPNQSTMPDDSLEQQLASLLGRANKN